MAWYDAGNYYTDRYVVKHNKEGNIIRARRRISVIQTVSIANVSVHILRPLVSLILWLFQWIVPFACSLYWWIAKVQARRRGCAVSPEPMLYAYAITAVFLWHGSICIALSNVYCLYLLKFNLHFKTVSFFFFSSPCDLRVLWGKNTLGRKTYEIRLKKRNWNTVTSFSDCSERRQIRILVLSVIPTYVLRIDVWFDHLVRQLPYFEITNYYTSF